MNEEYANAPGPGRNRRAVGPPTDSELLEDELSVHLDKALRERVEKSVKRVWPTSSPDFDQFWAKIFEKWYRIYGSKEQDKLDFFARMLLTYLKQYANGRETRFESVRESCPSFADHRLHDGDEFLLWILDVNDCIREFVLKERRFGIAVDPTIFKQSLEKADWSVIKDENKTIDLMLFTHPPSTSHHGVHLHLNATFQGTPLGLRINGHALRNYRELDERTRQYYPYTWLESNMYAIHLDPTSFQTTFVMTFGDILRLKKDDVESDSTSDSTSHSDTWVETGFVLMLELGLGGKPGDYYIVCNSDSALEHSPTTPDIPAQDELFWKPGRVSPLFTVAKVNRGDLSLSSFFSLPTESPVAIGDITLDDSPDMQLDIVSVSKPEILRCGSFMMSRISLVAIFPLRVSNAGNDVDNAAEDSPDDEKDPGDGEGTDDEKSIDGKGAAENKDGTKQNE